MSIGPFDRFLGGAVELPVSVCSVVAGTLRHCTALCCTLQAVLPLPSCQRQGRGVVLGACHDRCSAVASAAEACMQLGLALCVSGTGWSGGLAAAPHTS